MHEEKDQLTAKLLKSSLSSISKEGLDNFSMRNLAAKSKCSTTAISNRFPSKAILIESAQEYALEQDIGFHKQLASELKNAPITYETFAELVTAYIRQRTLFPASRFWSEMLTKSKMRLSSQTYLKEWIQVRTDFWQNLLLETHADNAPELASIITSYTIMEEFYAYEIGQNIQYPLLVGESARALLAKSFGAKSNASKGAISLWLSQGGISFLPEKETHNELAENLVELASNEILKNGINSLNQRNMTKKAGVSSAMIAYHFGNMTNFINDSIMHALVRGAPAHLLNPKKSNAKQKTRQQWAQALQQLTLPQAASKGAGFYTDYARLTGQACLLAANFQALNPLVLHLRRIDGWGTYHSSKTLWPTSLTVDRGSATVFAVWLKGQSIINEAVYKSEAIPMKTFNAAAKIIFP
jgi:AcrR family transcriptional regulator